jgi:hypothetical protein
MVDRLILSHRMNCVLVMIQELLRSLVDFGMVLEGLEDMYAIIAYTYHYHRSYSY